MNKLLHTIITDLKFLYPCIAYEKEKQNKEDNIIYITTETKASKLYPVVKVVKDITNIGEDYWGRTTFCHEETNQ